MIVVSKCLLGINCKYDGTNNFNKKVINFLQNKEYIAVCPEQLGGLPTPRIPCERIQDKVMNKIGEDKTRAFYLGSCLSIELLKGKEIEFAILKSKSPSCGFNEIYDGTFSNTLTLRHGFFVEEILKLGINIYTEKDF